MTDLSVALVAASDSNTFDVAVKYGRDKSDDFISKLNRDRTNILTYGPNAGRRAIRVHSAIATILVSQPSDEVIAVGAARSEDGLLTIYISASGGKSSVSTLHKARLHLENVWKYLSSLVDEHPQQAGDTSPELEFSSDRVIDLILCIYLHSMEKVIETFKKGDGLGIKGFITEAIDTSAVYVKEQAPKSIEKAYILRSELDILESLQTVLLVVRAYQENRSEENLKNFIAVIDAVCEEVDTLGHSVWSEASESLFSRCDRLMKERSNTRPEKVGAFAQFWREAFALHRAIKQLLYLTASAGMRSLLKGLLVVEVVPSQKGLFKYDLEGDSFRAVFSRDHPSTSVLGRFTKPNSSTIQSGSSGGSWTGKSSDESNRSNRSSSDSDGSRLTYDKFIAHYSAKRSLRVCEEVHVHCELALLAHFLTEEIEAYGFIGISKPCCLGCWFYFLAYNEVAKRSGRRLFHVLGTNSKAFYGWIKPILDVALDQEIEGVLAKNTENHFASIKKQFEPQEWSENTGASSGVVKIGGLARYMESSGGKKGFLQRMRKDLLQE